MTKTDVDKTDTDKGTYVSDNRHYWLILHYMELKIVDCFPVKITIASKALYSMLS